MIRKVVFMACLGLLAAACCARAEVRMLRLNQAPDTWTLKRLDTGKVQKLQSAFGGKGTLLYFWQPRCKPCVEHLKALSEATMPEGIRAVTLAAVSQADLPKAQAIAKTTNLPTFLDENYGVAKQFQVTVIPAYYVLGPGGALLTPRLSPTGGLKEKLDVYDDRTIGDLLRHLSKTKSVPLMVDPQKKLLGQPAPKLALPELSGKTITLDAYRGSKGILVIFFSPTCPHCQRELPRYKEFFESSGKARGLKIISAAMGNSPQAVQNARDYQAQSAYPWPVLLDPNGETLLNWKVSGYPTFYLLDGSLKIKAVEVGRIEDISAMIKNRLKI